MTEQEIREVEERAEKATEGEWWQDKGDSVIRAGEKVDYVCDIFSRKHPQSIADAQLICHARADILSLCKEVRILRGVIIKEAGYLPSGRQEANK